MKEYYGGIDGLRTLAAVGIVMMHMRANNSYEISGFIFNTMIPSFTNFVFLFMAVSAFGMCCGYYEKILKNRISVSEFYGNRFKKVLPFFGILVLLDIIISPSASSIYEGFADLTLMFGFLPDCGNITVIGVGWFLGLIFVFYLCFPFFCYLLENRKRAWLVFGVSLIYNFSCSHYFGVGRSNILYSACFFLAGGLIYLYRKELSRCNRWVVLSIFWVTVLIYFVVGGNPVTWILASSILLIYSILVSGGVLENGITKFFGGVSMEIYLSHMVIFRIIERIGLIKMIENDWLQYIMMVVAILIGTSIYAIIMQKIVETTRKKWIKMKDSRRYENINDK